MHLAWQYLACVLEPIQIRTWGLRRWLHQSRAGLVSRETESHPQNPLKKARQGQADLWGFLAGQPRLLGELQASEEPCLGGGREAQHMVISLEIAL